ncbi:hypothetical protein UFOVP1146_190 [uncultured Caudovirales phage]|uniref:Uncharacterized protein n=1 Tax=uncultured Caudovirales phage TaxID=2100421 RepID=A0A6J5P8E7_9CAUD|nr:hypothetical protein UFOVP812_103 [uncultured Caudovirales phage]CAB4165468.1 hypothetical protein UFOVP818_40 [uncultured Caudovirales phage]CAB4186844.1 hypothetical protein UFOVP1146_190 [uncultured Caudovirales phage]CAB4221548.1 hypothetical protein UFOVP1638_375 [uncultured Caudovirales phage]
MNEQTKQWIDNATYEELLSKWRFAAVGDSMLRGETGKYYSDIMFEKRQQVDHVQASKNIGWKG